MQQLPRNNFSSEKPLEKLALLALCSLLFLPYLFYIVFLIDAPDYAEKVVKLFITLHLDIISLIVTIHVFSERRKEITYPIDLKQGSLLLLFLLGLCLSFFQATYKSLYFMEFSCWIQAIYLYLMVALIIDFNAKDKVDPLITIMITTGTVIAMVMSIVSFYNPAYDNLRHNPIAEYLMIPFYLSLYRLYENQKPFKRAMYCCILMLILMFLLLSKSRAAWLGLIVSLTLLFGLKSNLLSDLGLALKKRPWERTIIALGIIGCVALGLIYNIRLHAFDQVGLDNTIQSLIHLDEGSIYSRFKLWINSLALLKDHFLLGVGLGHWKIIYPWYSQKVLFDVSNGYIYPVNVYLRLAIETGIIGAILFIAFLSGLLTSKSINVRSNTFLKCAVLSILLISFFQDMYNIFLPMIFILFCFLQNRTGEIKLNKNFLLGLCLIFNLLFSFQSILQFKDIEFTGVQNLARRYYLNPPASFRNPEDKFFSRWINRFAAASQHRNLDDIFLKITNDPGSTNLYLSYAMQEMATSKNYDKALYWVNKAAALSPLSYTTIKLKATWEFQSNRLWDAQRTCASYINEGFLGLWIRKILADTYKASGNQREALLEYEKTEEEFDYQLSSVKTQASLPKINDFLAGRSELLNAIDLLKENLHLKTRQDILEKIGSVPEFNKSLVYFQNTQKIIFSSNLMGGYDLFSFNRDDGRVKQLTILRSYAPFRLRASKDLSKVYFTSDWQGNYHYNIFYWDNSSQSLQALTHYDHADAGEYEIAPDSQEIAYILKKNDGDDLYLIRNGKIKQLTSDKHPKQYISWSPNSKDIAYVCDNNSICLYNILSRIPQRIVPPIEKSIKMLNFSADGKKLTYVTESARAGSQIYEYTFKENTAKELTQGGDKKLFPRYFGKNRIIYIKKDRDNFIFRLLNTQNGEDHPLGPSQGVIYGPSVIEDPGELLFFFSDKSTPCTLCSLSLDGKSFKKLFKLDDIHADDIIYPQSLDIKTADHYQLPVYYLPPYHYMPNKRYPAIIWFHGAHEEFSPRWHMYTQYFAMNGFSVFAVNYRENNARDIFQLYQYVKNNPGFNISNTYMVGVSSGAFVLEKTLQQYPGLFNGAAELVGCITKYLDAPLRLPPMKVFIGQNDAYVNNKQKLDQIALQELNGGLIEVNELKEEGHDFRHKNNIKGTLKETVLFFKKIEDKTKPCCL